MNRFDVITYKEALQQCLELNKKLYCDYDTDLEYLGILLATNDKYYFCPLFYNNEMINL